MYRQYVYGWMIPYTRLVLLSTIFGSGARKWKASTNYVIPFRYLIFNCRKILPSNSNVKQDWRQYVVWIFLVNSIMVQFFLLIVGIYVYFLLHLHSKYCGFSKIQFRDLYLGMLSPLNQKALGNVFSNSICAPLWRRVHFKLNINYLLNIWRNDSTAIK